MGLIAEKKLSKEKERQAKVAKARKEKYLKEKQAVIDTRMKFIKNEYEGYMNPDDIRRKGAVGRPKGKGVPGRPKGSTKEMKIDKEEIEKEILEKEAGRNYHESVPKLIDIDTLEEEKEEEPKIVELKKEREEEVL